MGTQVYLVYVALISFVVLAWPTVAQVSNITLPLTYPAQVLPGDDSWTCPTEEERQTVRDMVSNATRSLLEESVVPHLQTTILPQTGHPCGGTGWRRVVYLNMSDPSQQCPSVWREITSPHRTCGNPNGRDCAGPTYTTGSEQYNQVCGRIIGYQVGSPDAFYFSSQSIDSYYIDGVSVTHGFPRQHIWSFVCGVDETTRYPSSTCPCITGSTGTPPSFVGQNYFCETGQTQWNGSPGVFWSNGDPLWDGLGCGPTSTCCSFNSPPWFNVQLPSPTTDYIEVRICLSESIPQDDVPVQLIELYVK